MGERPISDMQEGILLVASGGSPSISSEPHHVGNGSHWGLLCLLGEIKERRSSGSWVP